MRTSKFWTIECMVSLFPHLLQEPLFSGLFVVTTYRQSHAIKINSIIPVTPQVQIMNANEANAEPKTVYEYMLERYGIQW